MAISPAQTLEHSTKPDSDPRNITRREFLNYVLGASVALLSLEAAGAAVWFATPQLNIPQGNLFQLDPASLPAAGSSPVGYAAGRFWISNTTKGLLALYMACPAHYKRFIVWFEPENNFRCPLCGGRFETDGTHIQGTGSALLRNLDRFFVLVTTPTGTTATPTSGDPVRIDGATKIQVSTYYRILGKYDDGFQHSPAFVAQPMNGMD